MQIFKKNNLVVLVIIALPSLFYFGLKTGNHQYKRLPIYSEHQQIIQVKKSTKTFYTLENFSFINQNGKTFSGDDLKDKITIIGFFDTDEALLTPVILTNLKYLQQKFEKEKNVQFLAVSTKTLEAYQLKEMAQKVTKNTDNFYFVSTNQLETNHFIKQKLYIKSVDNHNIITDLVLIDFRGRIRSYFDGTVHKIVKQDLTDAIDILLKELFVPLKEDKKPLITIKKP